jgi:hypothetical protein
VIGLRPFGLRDRLLRAPKDSRELLLGESGLLAHLSQELARR